LAARTDTRLDDVLLELLRGPIKVVAFVICVHLGLTIFDWSPTAMTYLTKLLILIVAGSLTYVAIKVINLLLETWRQRTAHEENPKFNDQLFVIIRRSLNVFVVTVAVLVTAQNIGINITAVITSLSIGGLAVGLAAQDTLANLFGAVAVFADKPFRVGDHIKLADAEGTVEAVGMRSTRIRNLDGQLAVIPNKTVANAAVINISKRPSIKTVMNLTLAHDLPGAKVKRALALLTEIYRGDPLTQDVWISFNQFAGRNLNILVMLWSKGADYQKYLASLQEMNLAVKERFEAEGIVFAS
jgi:MscS family membrane protein